MGRPLLQLRRGRSAPASTLYDGLVMAWAFGEDAAAAPAADYGGVYHLTAVNSPGVVAGQVGGARSDGGTAGYFTHADADALDLGGGVAWTIAGWLYPTVLAGSVVFAKGAAGSESVFATMLGNGKLRWETWLGPTVDMQTTNAMTVNTWYPFRYWLDPTAGGAHGRAFVQLGATAATSSGNLSAALQNNTGAWWIGRRANSTFGFAGRWDAWARWSRVLTTDEWTEFRAGWEP